MTAVISATLGEDFLLTFTFHHKSIYNVSQTFQADNKQWMEVVRVDEFLFVYELNRADDLSDNNQQITCHTIYTRKHIAYSKLVS